MLSGPITRADVDDAEVMASLIKNGQQKIAGNSVWLASDGGDIDAAMDLGRLLRRIGLFTFIGGAAHHRADANVVTLTGVSGADVGLGVALTF